MIEKLLDEAVKPFEALLTKQRCIMFLLSSFMLSSVLFEFVELCFSNPPIAEVVSKVGEVFSKIEVFSFFLMLAWCFYLSPRVIYLFFAYLNKTELIRQRRAVEQLRRISEKDDSFFVENYYLISEMWRREKDDAESAIRYRLEYLEVISSLAFLVLLISLRGAEFRFVYLAPMLLCALYVRESSTKNVASYLAGIAPYKLAVARIKSINEG